MRELKKKYRTILIGIIFVSCATSSSLTLATIIPPEYIDIPAEFTKEGAVDSDKFTNPTTDGPDSEGFYTVNYHTDPKYVNACGMANAAALLWGSGYKNITNAEGETQAAANLHSFFDWICQDYANLVNGGNDPYPGMGLGQQKNYMEKYLGDSKTNPNPTPNPRTKVDAHSNIKDGKNFPLTTEQVNSLKEKLVACSLVSLILQRQNAQGETENHEVQLVGWTTDGKFKIFDPDTDREIWDAEAAKFTFEDTEYWDSSLTDDKWRITTEGLPNGTYDVIGYKTFSTPVPVPEPATLLLFGLGAAILRKKR